jgi:hypothetical protein
MCRQRLTLLEQFVWDSDENKGKGACDAATEAPTLMIQNSLDNDRAHVMISVMGLRFARRGWGRGSS